MLRFRRFLVHSGAIIITTDDVLVELVDSSRVKWPACIISHLINLAHLACVEARRHVVFVALICALLLVFGCTRGQLLILF